MKTISAEEFKKQYGENAFNQVQNTKVTGFKEFTQDLAQTGRGITNVARETFQKQTEAFSADQPLASKLTQAIGIGAGGASGIAGEVIKGGVKAVLPQEGEEALKSGIQKVVSPIMQSEPVKNLISKYESLDENTKRDVDSLLGIGSFVADVAGLGLGAKGVKAGTQVAKEGIETTVKGSLDVATKLKQIAGSKTVKVADEIIPIPETTKTTLKRTSPEQLNKYLEQAKKATTDQKEFTPLELAGERAVEALDSIQTKLKTIGEQKSTVLNRAKTGLQPMGNVAVKARQTLQQKLGKLTLDSQDASLLKDLNTRLKGLGENPTVKQVDEFVDYAQEQLYKGTSGLTVNIGSRTESVLRGLVGELNGKVKKIAGKSYEKLNQRYADTIEVRNTLNKVLGTDASKGGSLLKRVFSPTDGGTKKLFENVKKLTGIDLTDDAVLAKFAMELYGDTRQRSLLQQLNIPTQAGIIEKILQTAGGVAGVDDFLRNLKVSRAKKIQSSK